MDDSSILFSLSSNILYIVPFSIPSNVLSHISSTIPSSIQSIIPLNTQYNISFSIPSRVSRILTNIIPCTCFRSTAFHWAFHWAFCRMFLVLVRWNEFQSPKGLYQRILELGESESWNNKYDFISRSIFLAQNWKKSWWKDTVVMIWRMLEKYRVFLQIYSSLPDTVLRQISLSTFLVPGYINLTNRFKMASVQTQLEHLRASNSFKQFEEEFFKKWLEDAKLKIHGEEERRMHDMERVKGILKMLIYWYHFLVLHICHQALCIIPGC